MKSQKLVLLLVCFVSASETTNALECYVCRGADCAEVSEDQVQMCPSSPISTEPPEPTTDMDMDFDQSIDVVKVEDLPLLNEEEVQRSSYVLDKSELPGAKYLGRGLKEYRDDGDDARCVVAIFRDDNSDRNVVRGCSFTNTNETVACNEAIGDGYTGELSHCRLCAEDLCNSSRRAALAFGTMILGLLVELYR